MLLGVIDMMPSEQGHALGAPDEITQWCRPSALDVRRNSLYASERYKNQHKMGKERNKEKNDEEKNSRVLIKRKKKEYSKEEKKNEIEN